MTKEKTYKEKDNDEKKGKKKFIERLAEDKEAQKEIEDYLDGRNEFGVSKVDHPER